MLRAVHQFFKADVARVIVAVSDHEQNFLLAMTFLLEVRHRRIDSVAHGGAAARIDARNSLFHFLDVAGQGDIQIRVVIEIDDEHLVLRVGSSHQIERSALHSLPFFPHAAAVVDDDAERNRNILAAEDLDGLLDAVFKDLERFLLKVGHQFAVLVHNADGQNHQARAHGEGGIFGNGRRWRRVLGPSREKRE